MGEEARAWNRGTNLSLDINKYPRDLLRGFMSENVNGRDETSDCEDETAVELNLGLSLGGRFGVDKTPRKLKRSSSVLTTMPFEKSSDKEEEVEPENYTVGLARTTSLPAEMEEEWKKRKEMQSLRRMDAKRRRFEKQSSQTASFLQRHLVSSKQDSDGVRGGGGGSSSSLSELDNKNQQGSSNSCGELSPKIITRCSSNNSESHGTENNNENGKGKGTDTSTGLFDMPCVFTKGDGPNGRRVDGILYKYGKGEEVRIMCICHGSFLTPAEFVKHGGGGDVDRPLRHIVVNTSPSRF